MRKLFTWYNTLQSTGNLKLKEENKESDEKQIAAKAFDEKNKASHKSGSKDNSNVKTSAGVKKTAGVRKTGTA